MGTVSILVRVMIVGVFAASLGWVFMAVLPEEGSKPGGSFVQTARRLSQTSKAPRVVAREPPPYRDWVGDKFNIRGCQCLKDWAKQPADLEGKCRCEGVCPPHVDPTWLTEGAGQALCSLETQTGYKCAAVCQHTSENAADDAVKVNWVAYPCGGPGQEECDAPILATRKAKQDAEAAAAKVASAPVQEEAAAAAEAVAAAPEEAAAAQPAEAVVAAAAAAAEEAPVAAAEAAYSGPGALTWDPKEVWDLRGLHCEAHATTGKETCFYEDSQGRELCPDWVTHEALNAPANQYLCSPDMAHKYFCTAACQTGNPELRWNAHEIAWCYAPANAGSCPVRPTPVPKAAWALEPWSEKPDVVLPCEAAHARGEKPPGPVAGLTFALLTHEPRSLADSLATYEAFDAFALAEEFLVYVNNRRPEIDDVLEPYVKKYPQMRVMGDATNVGIARAMTYLTGNASRPYFLFLERDFQLIEPATCVYEQLATGVALVKAGTAHVVRYRSQRHAGHPNWAELMFRGKEDDVFKGRQPNLFCNHHYWVIEADKRWPDKIWRCEAADQPPMYCSDSFYCNWTNNPQLWEVAWWNREYVAVFDKFQRNDPWYDLETYMNWEPNSWNSRKFIVAQGDGLYRHVDRGKFGY